MVQTAGLIVTGPPDLGGGGPARSALKLRPMSSAQLGLAPPPFPCTLPDDDARLLEVRALLEDRYAGVILTGPPGTSKTWYAGHIAAKLVDCDPERARFIQFHASYQYEDFVEGYVPQEEGGFALVDKHLLEMCEIAREVPGQLCVLVIDELSRCDPGRVFGEALTYIEMSRRDQDFALASGRFVSIPDNLFFIATMNPLDRGVDDVDVALERRFAKIALDPDETLLTDILTANGVDAALQKRILTFFRELQKGENLLAKVGHAYFRGVKDQASLERLWTHQLRFYLEKAFRLDPDRFNTLRNSWESIVVRPTQQAPVTSDGPTPPATDDAGTDPVST